MLIVTILEDEVLQDLYSYATELGLNIIVEVHDEDELKRALKISPKIIGINNRNLKTFTVDIGNSERLLKNAERMIFISSPKAAFIQKLMPGA